ncbi:MAG TPA: sigma-70 family RNA polymerase sigma factor [Humisphaera sp.]|jgi:RNA polymerase sigma-70 factor (ECF subfamily)|nr:sigma-70 family RNA polymerase sigma factor [Humisphaera sp.]
MQHPEPALDDVVREHGQSVWKLIVRLVGNDDQDAADCFQQAFVELAARHRRLKDIREAGPLLKRIAAARAVDSIRRRIRERGRSSELSATLVAARSESEPCARADAAELLDDLRSALGELPEPQSAAFVLTQIEELSRGQAARALGVTVNHLGVLLHRACATLRRRLEPHRPVREHRHE